MVVSQLFALYYNSFMLILSLNNVTIMFFSLKKTKKTNFTYFFPIFIGKTGKSFSFESGNNIKMSFSLLSRQVGKCCKVQMGRKKGNFFIFKIFIYFFFKGKRKCWKREVSIPVPSIQALMEALPIELRSLPAKMVIIFQ